MNKTRRGLYDGQEEKKKKKRAQREEENEKRDEKGIEGKSLVKGVVSGRCSKFVFYDGLGRKKSNP